MRNESDHLSSIEYSLNASFILLILLIVSNALFIALGTTKIVDSVEAGRAVDTIYVADSVIVLLTSTSIDSLPARYFTSPNIRVQIVPYSYQAGTADSTNRRVKED